MKYQFPENFKWGSAVWAQGTEGAADKDGKAPTVWDEYYRLQPGRFVDCIGPDKTLNWYEDYDKYAALAKDIAHNSFRTSIMWARLIPDGKHINQEAVTFYKNLFHSFKDRGMEMYVVLYWFDMPLQYEEKGGFTNREILDDFVFYCKTCFELFDGLVDIWYIYNEPIVDVFIKYLKDICYPNKLDFDGANQAVYNMVIAHAKVVEVYKQKTYKGKIGSVLNHSFTYPRSNHPADLEAVEADALLYRKCFSYPLLKGYMPKEWFDLIGSVGKKPMVEEGDEELIRNNTIRVLGLNIYGPSRVKAKEYALHPKAPITYESFMDAYEMHGREMNPYRGWEIYPKVLYDVLMEMKNEYGNPEMYITENGMGVQDEYRFKDENGIIQDDYRIDYVKRHLQWAHLAIQEGANLNGYHMWSFIDLWSPTNQFKNCYGFYEYNLKTGESSRKKSAYWIEKVTKDNGFEE